MRFTKLWLVKGGNEVASGKHIIIAPVMSHFGLTFLTSFAAVDHDWVKESNKKKEGNYSDSLDCLC